jgi:hypothetical protein
MKLAPVWLVLLVVGLACSEKHEAPPPPMKLTREAVEQAVAQKKASDDPQAGVPFGPWGRWERLKLGNPYVRLSSVWGTSNHDVWILGGQLLAHNDGHGFALVPSFSSLGAGVLGGRSPTDRWIMGSNSRHATDGDFAPPTNLVPLSSHVLKAMATAPDGSLWVVGEAGQVLHQEQPEGPWAAEVAGPDVPAYAGGKTSPTRKGEAPHGTTKPTLSAVWAAGDRVYAAGELGTLLVRSNPGGWEAEDSGTQVDLHGLWGASPQDLWAVGDHGTLLHQTGGSTWQSVSSGTEADLYAVWGNSPTDVWAVGSAGAMLHWDGKVWTPIPSGTQEVLLSLWGDGQGELWAVGGNATVLHHLPR